MTSMVEDAIAIRVGNMYHVMACPEHRDSPCTFFTSLSILFHHHDLLQIPQLLARTPMLRVIRVFFTLRAFQGCLHQVCTHLVVNVAQVQSPAFEIQESDGPCLFVLYSILRVSSWLITGLGPKNSCFSRSGDSCIEKVITISAQ